MPVPPVKLLHSLSPKLLKLFIFDGKCSPKFMISVRKVVLNRAQPEVSNKSLFSLTRVGKCSPNLAC
ncbi:hypothetical protein AFCDBAGC_1292 [Methylobacterium cerastii]|uniref:Uncharacterized protein n=1 Tax=Methylobacterium cerastii TaxID=932741 RepID=A0ABQ4QDY9_9HYPH|nr:hypothetical protein AFCDBAGC_1292 [Methylobacterium cerastii]